MQWIDSAADRAGRELPPRLLGDSDQPLALFVDIDGTLVDLARRPHEQRLDPDLLGLLARLQHLLGGAVAVLGGRKLADIDALLQPLKLPAGALRGLQVRDAAGRVRSLPPAAGADKGVVLASLLQTPPFRGRAPLVLGDDRSDEPAFAMAEKLGGVGVIVGPHRPTCARHALSSPRHTGRWLAALASRLEQAQAHSPARRLHW